MTEPLAGRPTRRIVFKGLGALGVAAALAGCGGGDDDSAKDGGGSTPEPDSGAFLASTSEVPVDGGIILADQKIVLTQPTEGTFEAFSAVCTHQGAVLDAVDAQGIRCPLHGSRFSISDGSVVDGPATVALPAVEIKVEGDQILAV